MRQYKIRRLNHRVYEPNDPLPKNLKVVADWRDGHISDWVLADDECIIQVLRRGQMLRSKGKNKIREYIGTCTGTFPIGDSVKMDTSRRVNIYSFGGSKKADDILLDLTVLSKHEEMFVLYLASGMAAEDAYIKAFPTKNRNYAKLKSGHLVRTERIKTAMKEELKPVCEKLGVDPESVIKGIKDKADYAEKDETQLKALFKLSDILDLEDKNQTKVTQVTGALFQGFSEKMLEEAERPQIEE